MKRNGADSPSVSVAEPEVCQECHSVSRLTSGLCLNCLLRGALDEPETPSGKEAFKEVLAGVKSRDGDWHIADHEILDEIARGGMGVVYQAKEPHSGRIVALKCVLAYQGDSDHVLARFRREAETAARLDHPNIVPIYQVGETADGFPYYTMKYAPAGSLVQAGGPLRQHPRQSVQLLLKVARAVHFAHEKGVLHRDLKPGNILLDNHGEPLVSDFGLARCEAASSYLTRSLASFGTPGYIAPEQADGPAAHLTPSADVYSLGAILFELLAGRPPFVGDNAFAVMKRSSEEPAPKVRTLARHADRDLETICARCLERDPADRYQSAASLAEDLENWLEDRPIAARRPGMWRQSRRWVRQNRGLAALLGAFCLLGAASLAWQINAQRSQSSLHENVLARRSVTVVPFYDLDAARVDLAFTQAFAASLQDGLTSLGPARVTVIEPNFAVSRNRMSDLGKDGRKNLGRAIVTGMIRRVQGRQRISFQLVDPASKETLFSHFWEESDPSDGRLAFPKQVAQSVYPILSANDWADIIQAKSDPGLRNKEANQAMKAGRLLQRGSAADMDKAIALFRRAVELEPNSSLAHAYLAMEATNRMHYSPDRSFLALAKKEAEIALRLSPSSFEAHRALSGVYYQEGKFPEALEQALQTIELGGLGDRIAMFVGLTLDMLGQPHLALSWHEMASQLSPTPGEAESSIGDCWVKMAADERAEQTYKRATELRPHDSVGLVGLARLRMLQGNFAAAREICLRMPNTRGDSAEIAAQIEFFERRFDVAVELYRDLHKVNPYGGGSFFGAMSYCSAAGRAKQALGDLAEAKRILEECLIRERGNAEREPGSPEAVYRLAAAEASLGMTEAALSHLKKSIALGWVDYRSLSFDPRFDALRGPEFQAIIDELTAKVSDMQRQALARR
jgi:serine/threonine protein kinase/tetratricopeptide (TPR) repeat protein